MASVGGGAPFSSREGLLRDLIRPPFRKFVVDTELAEAEIVERLRGIVEPRGAFLAGFRRTNKLFAGEVSPQGFKITRLIYYGNASLPVVIGTFEPGPNGARVQVTMRPTQFAIAFGTLWFGFMVLFTVIVGLVTISAWWKSGAVKDGIFSFLPVAMLAFGYLLAAVTFGAEARKARRLLEEALQTRPGPRIQKVQDSAPPRLPRFAKWLLGVGGLAVAGSALTSVLGPPLFVRSEPYHIAENYIRLDPVVQFELGPVSGIDFYRWGYRLNYAGPEGSGRFALNVKGTRGRGTVFVTMRRHLGVWQVSTADLREASGRIVTLRSATPDEQTKPNHSLR
jgi:hypothetical protein